jgi:hypothetical protein
MNKIQHPVRDSAYDNLQYLVSNKVSNMITILFANRIEHPISLVRNGIKDSVIDNVGKSFN